MRPHLASLIDEWRANGSQTAVVRYSGNRAIRTSYSQLYELATRFAYLLYQRGISAGERVVLWGQNSAEWIAAFFGCVLRGVLVVPLDRAGSAEFARRVIVFRDGRIRKDEPTTARPRAEEVLATLPALDD